MDNFINFKVFFQFFFLKFYFHATEICFCFGNVLRNGSKLRTKSNRAASLQPPTEASKAEGRRFQCAAAQEAAPRCQVPALIKALLRQSISGFLRSCSPHGSLPSVALRHTFPAAPPPEDRRPRCVCQALTVHRAKRRGAEASSSIC